MSRALIVAAAALAWTVATSALARESAQLTGVVNLNTASAAELDLLPGVGEKAARDIIAFRAKQPFRRIEDLVRVKGFGKKRFDKLKAHLAVIGNTTLQRVGKQGGSGQGRASPRR